MTVPAMLAAGGVALLTVALPVGGMLFFRRRPGVSWPVFFLGAATFVLSALVLEQLFHAAVLATPLGAVLQANTLLSAVYGGLAAGLFEETGRLAVFRLALKNETRPGAALACGLGHGGAEAVLLVGLTMVSNLALAALAAGGAVEEPALAAAAQTLAATPASTFLWAGFERITAVALHVSNSILVFAAVTRGRRGLYPLAILLHALVNFIAVACNAYLRLPIPATELAVALFTAAAVLLARRVYRSLEEAPAAP